MKSPFSGLVVPMITPFDELGRPAADRAIRFGTDLLNNGVNGLALFGTTSEGQSLSAPERMDLLDAMIAGGIDSARLMPGTGDCALSDAIVMTRHAVERQCGGVLLLPPYCYKSINDDGIFRFVAELIDKVARPDLRIYLYHIPPVAQVGFSTELVCHLHEHFPEQIVGLKNSSGSHDYTVALRENCPDLDVFCGSEDFLLDTMRAGGMGCISATGNANPKGILNLYNNMDTDNAENLQKSASAIRAVFQARPMIPSLKTTISLFYADPQWLSVRPPLLPFPEGDADKLLSDLADRDFDPSSILSI